MLSLKKKLKFQNINFLNSNKIIDIQDYVHSKVLFEGTEAEMIEINTKYDNVMNGSQFQLLLNDIESFAISKRFNEWFT